MGVPSLVSRRWRHRRHHDFFGGHHREISGRAAAARLGGAVERGPASRAHRQLGVPDREQTAPVVQGNLPYPRFGDGCACGYREGHRVLHSRAPSGHPRFLRPGDQIGAGLGLRAADRHDGRQAPVGPSDRESRCGGRKTHAGVRHLSGYFGEKTMGDGDTSGQGRGP
ncbi:hypothetical protein GALL_539960 [mine drainage metagenome]|uniref:Uncharacterized protein n=1 Tax=mine drainage metagenome TaxID=410659 RepID=A0A1J5PLP0_9ZZZZ